PLIPNVVNHAVMPRTSPSPLSVRWTGQAPSSEAMALAGLGTAKNVDEAYQALLNFKVGAANFVVADSDGGILYAAPATVPIRPAAAKTFNARSRPDGTAPFMVLPGDGSAEWQGTIPVTRLPYAKNPAAGFLVSANNDQLGVTLDN